MAALPARYDLTAVHTGWCQFLDSYIRTWQLRPPVSVSHDASTMVYVKNIYNEESLTYRYSCYIMVVLYMSMAINGKAAAVLGNSICGQCLSTLTNLTETAGGQTAGSILFILPSFAPQVSDTFLS